MDPEKEYACGVRDAIKVIEAYIADYAYGSMRDDLVCARLRSVVREIKEKTGVDGS